jgi:hypothetical protein
MISRKWLFMRGLCMALCIIVCFIFPAFACDNGSMPVNVSLAGGCDVPMVGSFSGSLSHKEEYQANVNVTNFIAEVTFKNSSTAGGRWDYGFLFRGSESTFHAIRVTSDGTWTHDVVTDGRWNYLEGDASVVCKPKPGSTTTYTLSLSAVMDGST